MKRRCKDALAPAKFQHIQEAMLVILVLLTNITLEPTKVHFRLWT
jgi:hypothetical protein